MAIFRRLWCWFRNLGNKDQDVDLAKVLNLHECKHDGPVGKQEETLFDSAISQRTQVYQKASESLGAISKTLDDLAKEVGRNGVHTRSNGVKPPKNDPVPGHQF